MKPWMIPIVLAGCSGGAATTTTTPTPPPDAAPAPVPAVFEPAAFLTGAWTAASLGTTLVWLRPGRPDAAIYGVVLTDPPVVWVIDDEPVDVPADQRWLRLTSYDDVEERLCDIDRDQIEGVWFDCADDAGSVIRFMQNGELLDYELATDDSGPFTFHHSPVELDRAPEAEAADPKQPTRSALSPDGTIAVTAGVFEATVDAGTYVTVWRKDPNAGWVTIFSVGRTDPP